MSNIKSRITKLEKRLEYQIKSDVRPCVFCDQDCIPAPNNRGWFQFGHKRIHFDCVDRLKETSDAIQAAPVLEIGRA